MGFCFPVNVPYFHIFSFLSNGLSLRSPSLSVALEGPEYTGRNDNYARSKMTSGERQGKIECQRFSSKGVQICHKGSH